MKKIFLIITLVTLTACETTQPSPFKVARADIEQKVRTIGLLPLRIPIDNERAKIIEKNIEESITNKLKTAGYNVIPSASYSEIYDRFKSAAGPMYDPNTGELNEEKANTLSDQTKRVYLGQNAVNALMYIGILPVKAEWNQNRAAWHGVEEPSTGKTGFWAHISAAQQYGTLPALSMAILLRAEDETELYSRMGGIQLLAHLSGGGFVEVPEGELLIDDDKIQNAINFALDPLTQSAATAP